MTRLDETRSLLLFVSGLCRRPVTDLLQRTAQI